MQVAKIRFHFAQYILIMIILCKKIKNKAPYLYHIPIILKIMIKIQSYYQAATQMEIYSHVMTTGDPLTNID